MSLVAWQHSGAAQYRRARDDRSDGDTADHQVAPVVDPKQRAQQRTVGRDPKESHPLRAGENRVGEGGWRAQPVGTQAHAARDASGQTRAEPSKTAVGSPSERDVGPYSQP